MYIVVGIIAACDPRTSADGAPMKHFELVDNKNNSVELTAFGRHCQNDLITNGNEVVIFIASGLISQGATKGRIWVYDKAHVWLRRSNLPVPQTRKLLMLNGKSP